MSGHDKRNLTIVGIAVLAVVGVVLVLYFTKTWPFKKTDKFDYSYGHPNSVRPTNSFAMPFLGSQNVTAPGVVENNSTPASCNNPVGGMGFGPPANLSYKTPSCC
jgi:hypothetical protein